MLEHNHCCCAAGTYLCDGDNTGSWSAPDVIGGKKRILNICPTIHSEQERTGCSGVQGCPLIPSTMTQIPQTPPTVAMDVICDSPLPNPWIVKKGVLITTCHNMLREGVADLVRKSFTPSYVCSDPLIHTGRTMQGINILPAGSQPRNNLSQIPEDFKKIVTS